MGWEKLSAQLPFTFLYNILQKVVWKWTEIRHDARGNSVDISADDLLFSRSRNFDVCPSFDIHSFLHYFILIIICCV